MTEEATEELPVCYYCFGSSLRGSACSGVGIRETFIPSTRKGVPAVTMWLPGLMPSSTSILSHSIRPTLTGCGLTAIDCISTAQIRGFSL